ncbi:radial spoke head 1 homolog isoform X1 [Diachasmimorpha longicaudata]|uniref:radial spoke head 1 homolog isoform X1 n=1 Tax=Diachasmimorpha longicaudata TaxID=58733 RepID=UPI0030B8C667
MRNTAGEEWGERGEAEKVDILGVYEGEKNSKGERHGIGKYQFPNGDVYVGGYCQGLRNNQGVYVFKNGARYDGTWRGALKYGRGTFFYPDGTRYEGEWKKDKKSGFGVYYYSNKDIYEGAWRNDVRHGLGTYHFNESGIKFMGTWLNDCIEGPGELVYPRYHFHGSWKDNLPYGRGCFVFENNCMQHGHYIHQVNSKDQQDEVIKNKQQQMDSLPVWCARCVTTYKSELLPPEARPLNEQATDDDSLTDECRNQSSNESEKLLSHSSDAENDVIDYRDEFMGEI